MSTVTPKTFLIGMTAIDVKGLTDYLKYTGNEDFLRDMCRDDLANLVSFYAKLCYASLSKGKNDNLTRTRSVEDNIKAVLASAHGSVLEHVTFNFVTTDCSRVFTHELIRHRVGTAFSQTSGRYVRTDSLEVVLEDPILEKYGVLMQLYSVMEDLSVVYNGVCQKIFTENPNMSFEEKKKVTSALRRILPNGQANEIGWSANVRALRHLIQMRTSRHAEWEIRTVFAEVFALCSEKTPILFSDANVEIVDGLPEVTGMKTLPY